MADGDRVPALIESILVTNRRAGTTSRGVLRARRLRLRDPGTGRLWALTAANGARVATWRELRRSLAGTSRLAPGRVADRSPTNGAGGAANEIWQDQRAE